MTTDLTAAISEAEFQKQVTDLAELLGWKTAHFRPALTSRGWRTPVQGTLGRGFPDLILVRDRVIFAELKADKGKTTPDQDYALDMLQLAGAECYVWHPAEFDAITEILR